MKRRYTAAAAMLMVLGLCASASAAFDENLNDYTLDTMIVEADAVKNKFGDTITEQSYYRTGGDVKVITREEIEKRHYTDVTEAVKRLPGVSFQNPGFRGGSGGGFYSNSIFINGDARVIILVDGRRVDNLTSERGGRNSYGSNKSTGVNIDQVVNMEDIDKIEVIKGPGASVYGADATGGVINIITRKGGVTPSGSIDLSTGNWNGHKYALSYSGSAGKDNSWHYFVSANRDMSGDTKYKDGMTGEKARFGGSNYKEDGVNIRLDKDFNDKQNLKLWYNFKDGWDGYPLCTPRLAYYNKDTWDKIAFKLTHGILDENNKLISGPLGWAGEAKVPGYTNMFSVDSAIYGSFNKFKNNDIDIQYTFNKDNGMDSFVRVYNQDHKYYSNDTYYWGYLDGEKFNNGFQPLADAYNKAFPNGATDAELKDWIKEHVVPFPLDKAAVAEWLKKTGGKVGMPSRWTEEKNKGIQLQYAKSLGINDIIASVTYDQSRKYNKSYDANGNLSSSYTQRKAVRAYIQDKIHVSDKWDITPTMRYSWYSSFDDVDNKGNKTKGKGGNNNTNFALNSQYMFDDTSSAYLGWTKVYRPLKKGDYTAASKTTPLGELKDERGDVWTFGVRKDLTDKTSIAAHYDLTRMSNAIATLPIYVPDDPSITSGAVNAKEDKRSFNLTIDHQMGEHFNLSTSYAHMKDTWDAKDGWQVLPNWESFNKANINTAINNLRPKNHYAANLSYENRSLYIGLLTNWYTGLASYAFTDNRFLVMDLNVNYEFTDKLTGYIKVNNLTDEAYQLSYNASYGGGQMPSRCFWVGMKYKF